MASRRVRPLPPMSRVVSGTGAGSGWRGCGGPPEVPAGVVDTAGVNGTGVDRSGDRSRVGRSGPADGPRLWGGAAVGTGGASGSGIEPVVTINPNAVSATSRAARGNWVDTGRCPRRSTTRVATAPRCNQTVCPSALGITASALPRHRAERPSGTAHTAVAPPGQRPHTTSMSSTVHARSEMSPAGSGSGRPRLVWVSKRTA